MPARRVSKDAANQGVDAKGGKPDEAEAARELRRRFGRWLKERREARGMTQADLAQALGLKYYSFISQVENGIGRIPQSLYAPWALALSIEFDEFAWAALSKLEPGLYDMLQNARDFDASAGARPSIATNEAAPARGTAENEA